MTTDTPTRPPAESTATIRLGQINERLAPIALTAEGLASLGFQPVGKDRAAVLYRLADLESIVAAIVKHLMNVGAGLAQQRAA